MLSLAHLGCGFSDSLKSVATLHPLSSIRSGADVVSCPACPSSWAYTLEKRRNPFMQSSWGFRREKFGVWFNLPSLAKPSGQDWPASRRMPLPFRNVAGPHDKPPHQQEGPPFGLGLGAHSGWNSRCWFISLGDREPLQGRSVNDSFMTPSSLSLTTVPSVGWVLSLFCC